MTAIAYRLRDVDYTVDGVTILEDVSLDVAYGRLLVLVGPNGAGKSSLLGVLAGDTAPTAGTVTLDDSPLERWDPLQLSRSRAVLLQANQVAFSFTGNDVIEMGRAPWIGSEHSSEDQAAIDEAIRDTDVGRLTERAFPTLSGGEKSRVSLARVLAQRTRIVLLDEPTAALDLRHQEEVLRIARRLAANGKAIVVVLHDLSLAAAYADEIAIIDDGRLTAHGTPEEVITAAQIEAVYGTRVQVLPDPITGRPLVIPYRTLEPDPQHAL